MTLGGSLYGRVYSIPAVPRAGRPSLDGGNLWEPGLASAEQSFTGKHQTPFADLPPMCHIRLNFSTGIE